MKQATNITSKMKPKAKMTARMATFIFHLSTFIFLAACTEDSFNEASSQHPDSPLTITATIPGDVWAVATRAGIDGSYTDVPGITVTVISYSDWTLHYTDYNGNPASGTLTAAKQSDGSYSLTSGSDLVWAKVQDTQDAGETFHLTCKDSDGATYYATTTAAHGAQAVAFNDAMKPTLAKLTVNFTLSHNMANDPEANDFAISINAKKAADSYDPMTHGGTWPIGDGDVERGQIFSQQSAATYTYTVTSSMLLPQQTMGNELIMTYKETSWMLNLSTVAVTGGEEGQKANRLIAGQHLTLNLSTSILNVGAPSDIRIEAFTAADADRYTPDLGGVAKTYEYDAANNTYYIYHEKFIEAALADRAANHPEAAVVSKAATLAIVDGAETDLTIVQAAIAGKTTIYVLGTTLAAYSDGTINNEAETVVGEAIRQLETNTTFSIVLPAATSIGEKAFYGCRALTIVSLPAATSIGENAFYNCTSLTSVSLPAATSIGEGAFAYCTALKSVSAPKATMIGIQAFYGCSALASVELPAAKTIEYGAFQACTALTSVSLPAATSIGIYAFAFCRALTSVSLPAATSIGNYAFRSCTALTSLTFGAVIERVSTDVFDGTLADGTTAWTTQCDLTLGTGQASHATYPADAAARTWAGKTWKSITLK